MAQDDVVVLTEPGIAYPSGPGVVTSPPARRESRAGEPWVAIVGAGVEPVPLDVPYERLAVAARVSVGERAFVVYGAVLPWLAVTRHAPELALPGEDFAAIFRRILSVQAADVAALRSRFGLPTIWAGDFNQSLSGPMFGSSRAGRDALVATLGDLGMVAWNETGAHATQGLSAVDLICGPCDVVPTASGRIDPERRGVRLSDQTAVGSGTVFVRGGP